MVTGSEQLLDEAARVIPGGVNTCRRRSEPRVCFRRGAGAYLWDLDGRRYVDYHAAYGAIFLGHSHPAVVGRVAEATRDTVLFGVGVTEAEVALARKLAEHVPSIEQSVVCNSGSEATYHAIRLARGVTGRELIIKFQGCRRRPLRRHLQRERGGRRGGARDDRRARGRHDPRARLPARPADARRAGGDRAARGHPGGGRRVRLAVRPVLHGGAAAQL
jgi:hypothetical protein